MDGLYLCRGLMERDLLAMSMDMHLGMELQTLHRSQTFYGNEKSYARIFTNY